MDLHTEVMVCLTMIRHRTLKNKPSHVDTLRTGYSSFQLVPSVDEAKCFSFTGGDQLGANAWKWSHLDDSSSLFVDLSTLSHWWCHGLTLSWKKTIIFSKICCSGEDANIPYCILVKPSGLCGRMLKEPQHLLIEWLIGPRHLQVICQ